ncbi:hypothetical protein L9G74_17480 [Shewanella sp. C32]|uniref:Double zinc ribbon n=1 Tax=Shewanella electrica TaxID=515560 RepID=A0ABT2FPG8_9GAMM|nr:hypothetical protein [Shewanella electrica]MCH1926613.1 hypothetical protein [Shewanella electrica]MCS4558234.1 hypothetical protein [Shewanella electrica]
MQHCNQPIFSNDKYCGHCGDPVESSHLRAKGIEQVEPQAMQELRNVYPNARVVSGKVVSTFYYKRKFVNNNNNLQYGFWWIELQDENGNIETTSIEAEDEFFTSIKKGDVLTLLYPTNFFLTHKIADSAARQIVKHNNTALCVINHLPEQQRSIRGGALNPSAKGTAWLWFFAWIAVAAAAYFGLHMRPAENAIGAGAVAALLCYLWERGRNRKKYEAGQHRFNVLKASMKQMLGVSRDDLGYQHAERPTHASDVICFGCQKRIPGSLQYCVSCGSDQQSQRHSDQPSGNIAEQESALMQQYSMSYKEDYLHKNLMSADQKGTVAIKCFLAKVISRDVAADVSDVSVTTTTTETTDHYYGNRYSHSTSNTRTRTDRTRDTGISGEVWLERANGERVKWQFSEQVLGDLDIGDWVFFSYSDVNVGDRSSFNRECGINISKDRQYSPKSFAGFGGFTGQGLWWVMAIFFGAWTYSDYRAPFFPLLDLTANDFTLPLYRQHWLIDFLPMMLFGVINIYLMIHGYLYSKRNAKRQKQLLQPMRDAIAKVQNDLAAIRQQIKTWG